jgi:hypothetical protein
MGGVAPTFITQPNAVWFTLGVPNSFSFAATGTPTPALSEQGALPPGVSFTDNGDGTATIAGTPQPTPTIAYGITVVADNGVPPQAYLPYTIVLAPDTIVDSGPPQVTTNPDATFTFHATTASSTFLCSLDGVITPCTSPFQALGMSPGVQHHFSVAAVDGYADPTPATYDWTVDGLAFNTPASTTFTAGVPGTVTVGTQGAAGSVAITESGSLPGGVTFTDNGDGTATIAGSPAAVAGSFPLTLTADDGITTATQSFTLRVNLPARPITVIDSGPTDPTTSTSATFTFHDTLGTATSFECTIDNGTAAPCTSGVSYSGLAIGAHTFSVTGFNVLNQSDLGPPNAAWHVAGITSADNVAFVEDTPGSFAVTTNGYVHPVTLTVTGQLPHGVSFIDNQDGTATLYGTPSMQTHGSHSFTITAHQFGLPDVTQSFTLTIDEPAPPTATFTSTPPLQTNQASGFFQFSGSPTTVSFQCILDGNPLPSCLSGLPTGPLAFGSHTLDVRAVDADGQVGPPASFTWTIVQPQFSSANNATFQETQFSTFTVTVSGVIEAVAIDDLSPLPSGVTFVDNGDGTATLSGTPAVGTAGPHTLTLEVRAGLHTIFDTQTFTLTVGHAPGAEPTTTSILSISPAQTAPGMSYLVTWSVVPTPPGSGTPTGSVTVSDGTNSCNQPVFMSSCSLASSSLGTKTITATYTPDTGGFLGSQGTATHQVVSMLISSVSPSTVIAGAKARVLDITGAGFVSGAKAAISGVVGGKTAFVSSTHLTLTINIPGGGTVGPHDVTVAVATTRAVCTGCLVVDPVPPKVSKVSYHSAPGAPVIAQGATVRLDVVGSGFAGASVSFSDPGVTGTVVSETPTLLVVDVSVGSSVSLFNNAPSITVTNADHGAATLVNAFQVFGQPVFVGAPVHVVASSASHVVSLTGDGFAAAPQVSAIGPGGASLNVTATFVSPTVLRLSFATLAGQTVPGAYDLALTQADGGTGTCTGCLVVDPVPVTIVTPSSAPVAGGTTQTITVTGFAFQAGLQVKLSGKGMTISNVVWVDANTVKFDLTVAVSAAKTARKLTITNPDGTTASKASAIIVM